MHKFNKRNMTRHCTMPNIPFFRDWFEENFGDLCEQHDAEYAFGDCKLCSDYTFVKEIGKRGYWYLVPFVYIAINLPWVWFNWLRRR